MEQAAQSRPHLNKSQHTRKTKQNKKNPNTRSLCMLRRQGIRHEPSRRTASPQAHSEQAGGGADAASPKAPAAGKGRSHAREGVSKEDGGGPDRRDIACLAFSRFCTKLFHFWRITRGAKEEEGNFTMVLVVCIFLFMRVPPGHHRLPPPCF